MEQNIVAPEGLLTESASAEKASLASGLSKGSEAARSQRERSKVHSFHSGSFVGPLDLLWTLIKESRINVYDIPIAPITDQYLDYLDTLTQTDLIDMADFYYWAAKLLNIKSRMLLPVEITSEDEDDEDPRGELVDTLIEYQKYRRLSQLMEKEEDTAEYTFQRESIQRVLPFGGENDVWAEIDTWDLLQQMQKAFQRLMKRFPKNKIINMYEEVSVNEKLTLIRERLEEKGKCMFSELITRADNDMDTVCAFMALLEAVKSCVVVVYQNTLFGDIKIVSRK